MPKSYSSETVLYYFLKMWPWTVLDNFAAIIGLKSLSNLWAFAMCKGVYPSLGIIQILAKLTYGCFCFSSIMEHPERFRSRGLLGKSRHGVNVHCPCSRPSASLLVDGLELLQNQKTSCADERISCHVSRDHLLLQLSPELPTRLPAQSN